MDQMNKDQSIDEYVNGDLLSQTNDLLSRASILQEELQQFSNHLSCIYADYFQQVPAKMCNTLSKDIQAEILSLRKILEDLQSNEEFASHRAHSSNLPFYEALWATAKRSKDIVALQYSVSSNIYSKQILAPGTRIVRSHGGSWPSKDCNFIIDIVADGGQSWWKVSSMTNKRLMFDMAREAILCEDSSDSENEEDQAYNALLSDGADIPLIKIAKNIASAVRGYRIRTKFPTPYLVLPRMTKGEHPKIDIVLNVCHNLGVNVICGNSLSQAPTLSAQLLETMAPNPKAELTETLNIDTSVLVGLASDFSHSQAPKQPWFKRSHLDHVELEKKQPAHSLFYPILGTHKLVCTKEAEETFRHIVHTIGTEDEKTRADCLMWGDSQWTMGQRREKLQSLSIHNVPPGLQLPIQVVQLNRNVGSRLSEEARETVRSLHDPGRSVFLYGWETRQTTLTCNSVAVKELEKKLESLPTVIEKDWPSIWVFPTSRPLVGTPPPPNGHKRIRKHIDDCSSKCTCGMQELSI